MDLGKTLTDSIQKKAIEDQVKKLNIFMEELALDGFTIVPVLEMIMVPMGSSLNFQATNCSYKIIPITEEAKKRAKENREKRIADEQKNDTSKEE